MSNEISADDKGFLLVLFKDKEED